VRGLDTNVLLRYLTGDDPVQSPIAKGFLEHAEAAGDRLYISTTVLAELCWTLRGKPYAFGREAVAGVIESLIATNLFEVQDRDLVRNAARDFRAGRGDFPDYLIGQQNRRAGCPDTVTFDGKLAKSKGYTLLPE
jgi:predicted nucleic-acid-binding protein